MFTPKMVKTPRPPLLQVEEESFEILYKCLKIGSMYVKADLLPESYLAEEARPEGRPVLVVSQSAISFRIRLQKTNCQHHIRIPREDVEAIRVFNEENPGFMLLEISDDVAEKIRDTLRMKREFGPYLDPNAIEMEKKYIVAHCDSRIIPTIYGLDGPFMTYMKFYAKNSDYLSFFQTLKKEEVHTYIPMFFNKREAVDDREEFPLLLAQRVKSNQKIKKQIEAGKGDRFRVKTYEELLAEDLAKAARLEDSPAGNRRKRKSTPSPTSSSDSDESTVDSPKHASTNGTNGHNHRILNHVPIVINSSDEEDDLKMEVDEAAAEPNEGKKADFANIINLEDIVENEKTIADDESTLTADSPISHNDDSLDGMEQLPADKDEEPPSPKPETIIISPSTSAPSSPTTSAATNPSIVNPLPPQEAPPKVDESVASVGDDLKLRLETMRKKMLADISGSKKMLADISANETLSAATKKTDATSPSTEKKSTPPPSSPSSSPKTTIKKEKDEEKSPNVTEEKSPDVTEDQPSTSTTKLVKEPIIRKARKTNGKRPISKYLMLPDERAKITADDSPQTAGFYQQIRSDMMTEMKLTPLCQCNLTVFKKVTTDFVCCMALEMVYGRIIGCSKPQKPGNLYRSQSNKPGVVLCEEHAERMFRHENCPGCGMFCVGGKFIVCIKCSDVPHRFHRECASAQCNVETCLHCGATSDYHREVDLIPGRDLEIEYLANGQDPDKLIRKHYLDKRIRAARIKGDNKLIEKLDVGDLGEDEVHKCSRTLPDGKIIDLSGLPPGPDRSQMLQIIKHMVPGKKTSNFYPSKFINAVRESNVAEVMNSIVNLNLPQNHFSTFNRALFVAYDSRVKTILYVLFIYGCDPNVKNPSGQTLLYKAVQESNYEYIYWLLLQGANPRVRDDRCGEGMTPFHLAAMRGDIRSVYLMLNSHKIDINMRDNDDWTPFCLAAREGDAKMAEYLLCLGADPNIFSNTGYNGLHWAVKSKNVDVVRLCLQKGMNVDQRCIKGGNTALHIAASNSDYLITTLLLAKGANPNAKNNQSKTPQSKCDQKSMPYLALRINSMGREFFNKQAIPPHFERVLCEDMSRGHAAVPVSCVNSVDSVGCPTCEISEKQFRYVTDFIVVHKDSQPNMVLTPADTCDCKDTCGNNRTCTCCRTGCAYDDNGHLQAHLNPANMEPIYECTRMCACSKTCKNRVVQFGTRFRLQVYRTEYMGWGLRSLDAIPKGAFVIDYVGEIVSDEVADGREEDTYLFDLLENTMAKVYCVDANKYGNCSRFINHLCDANLYTIRCYTNHRSTPFPRLAFFSIKKIAPYEELGFDYGESFWNVKSRMNIFCQCYSPNCKYSAEHYARKRKKEAESDDEEGD